MMRDWIDDANSPIELAPTLLDGAASDSLIELGMSTTESVDDVGWLTEATLMKLELGA
jgi:hypothetical protein